jgi:DNA replication protein DnaC
MTSEEGLMRLVDDLSRVDLLHLDDLGAERATDWVLEQLYAIVNARYEEQRSLVITTNLDPAQLREQITERTVSRLIEMCGDPLALFGADRRMELRSA